MDPAVCPTHLVQDAPASEDAFGAHQRIAAAIAQLVETSQGGKCVGLLGTWGAGKSTVVQLLQQQLEQRESRVVWVFDAWAHEGDSLRRTFLESLIERLTSHKWLADKAFWNERLEYLAGRRKVTEQASRPHLSPLAIVLAISLLFVPIGSSLFDSRLDKGLSLSLSLAPDWPAIAGLLLAFAPLVVLLAYVGDLFLVRRRSAREVRESLRDALTLFVRQTDTAQRTETLESGEPTTLEFERAFFDVMAAALTPASGRGADGSRRLVIVVDNLDRVNTEQALAVWSTLQIFVRHRDSRETWLDNLWCVLPFDGNAIRRLWPQDSPDGNAIADSFLDKTFQVRFEVPLPLLSNWKDYLMAKLKEAMPSHEDEEFFRIYRLYTVRRTPGALSPTPREIKLFVNQVGSLHRQWQDTIPLPDLAYSVLLQRDGESITFESINQFPAPREVGLVSENIREHLAALAYGVPGKAAQQLLLREPILQALEAPDPPGLKALADSNEAFWLVLEQAVERGCEEWKTAEGGNLLHAAVALEQSGIQEGEPQSRVELLFRRIASSATGVSAWNPMDARAVDGILVLGARYRWLAAPLFDYFAAARTTEQAWSTGSTAPAFVEDYMRLASALNLAPTVPVPGPVSAYARLAAEVVTRDPDERYWSRFPPQAPGSFVSQLSTSEVSFDETLVAAVRVAWAAGVGDSWGPFVKKVREQMPMQPGDPANSHRLAILHALWDEPNAVDVLRQLVAEGVVATQLGSDYVKNDPVLSAAWIYTLLRFDEKLTSLADLDQRAPWFRLQLEQSVGEFGEHLGQAVLRMGRVETLFTVAREYPMARWALLQTVDYVARSRPSARVFPPSLLSEQWNDSFGSVGDGFYMAQSIAADNPGLSSALAAQPFHADRASMYAGALAVDNPDPALVTLAADGVQQASENDWANSFATQSGLSRIVESLTTRGVSVTLGTAATNAFSNFVPQLAKSLGTQWGDAPRKAVFEALEDEGKAQVAQVLFDNLPVAVSANRVPRLLTLLGRDWVESGSLSGNTLALGALIKHVLTALNDDWLSSLARALTTTPALVSGLDQAARAEIQSLIARDMEARQTPAAQTALASLAAVLASEGPAPVPATQ